MKKGSKSRWARDKRLQFRATEGEVKLILEKARAFNGGDLSDFLREAVLQSTLLPRHTVMKKENIK